MTDPPGKRTRAKVAPLHITRIRIHVQRKYSKNSGPKKSQMIALKVRLRCDFLPFLRCDFFAIVQNSCDAIFCDCDAIGSHAMKPWMRFDWEPCDETMERGGGVTSTRCISILFFQHNVIATHNLDTDPAMHCDAMRCDAMRCD